MADTKSSPEYAMLPAGTVVKWGKTDDEAATLQALVNCKALGATGATGSFVDCTTLIDTQKQFISDLPEGPEKSLGFVDDPTNTSFTAFLNAAEARETVQFYIELPNGRTATMIMALSGWQVNEITAPASEVIQITVNGKQNNITWGTKDDSPKLDAVTVTGKSDVTAGSTEQYTATLTPEGAEATITWKSATTATATIDSKGLLTAVAAGTTKITATATPKTGAAVTSEPLTVTVKAAE